MISLRCLALSLPLLLAGVASAAEWSVQSRAADRELGAGASLLQFSVSGPNSVDFTVVKFDSARCALRIVDQPDKSRATTLSRAMEGIQAMAGVNGGFFTKEFEPLGLMITDGKSVGSWTRSSLLGGVLVVKKGRPLLLWRDEFESSKGVTQLLQAGPRLVNNGLLVSGLEARSHRPRTFIATDNEGHWLLGIAQSTTIEHLAQILCVPGLVPQLEIARALNFDGGKSTGFWARLATGEVVDDPEFSTVRNFVAVVPRK